MAEEKVKGYLIIGVTEASGKNKEDIVVWEPNFVEGFVKVEIRGGPRNVKVQSTPKRVLANTISWHEELHMEVLEGSTELRLMLCREKKTATRTGTSVIAACGIFVEDILGAVPINKYFELFKPGAGGEGGFIRIHMNFVKDMAERDRLLENGRDQARQYKPQMSIKGHEMEDDKKDALSKAQKLVKKKKRPLLRLVQLVAVAAISAGAYKYYEDQKKDKDGEPASAVLEGDKKPAKRFGVF